MENMKICPICGATNLTTSTRCVRCARFLFPSVPSGEQAGPERQPFLAAQTRQSEQTQPPSRIVRSASRRKFLVGLLGSGAILALGSVGLAQMMQNIQVALNTKQYPYTFWDDLVGESYSPDLNLMAMVKISEDDSPQANLYIWDYQQQHMITLPTGPDYGNPVWSPDNRYLLFQAHLSGEQTALDLWDVQNQRKLRSYAGDDYQGFSNIQWSPDGSHIALFSDTFALLSPADLKPLSTFNPPDATNFTWSPDGHHVAFVSKNASDTTWNIQIWISLCALVALPLLVIDMLTLQGALWQFPFFLIEVIYLCSIFIPGAAAGIGRAIQMRVAGHYLHPSLQIDDGGISAYYGKEAIFIAWQDIRSFALVNSIAFSKVPGKKTAQREAYEISDGTNRICWLAGSPMPSYDLRWFGEVVLSAQDYTSFTQLLAALIVTKTGHPLLDFRLPLRKRKKSNQSSVLYPSSVQKEHV